MNQLDMFGRDTLADARELVEGIKRGDGEPADCPCCGQRCQRYRRKLNSQMVRWLVWLVNEFSSADDWVDVKKSSERGGDYAKLLYWGLVEHRPNDDPSKRSSGFWKPTSRGIAFVYNRLSVPSHVFLFDGELLGYDATKRATIVDTIGDAFDYQELMKESRPFEDWNFEKGER